MSINSSDYVKSYTLFSSFVSSQVVELVNKIADADDERAISPLRILNMMQDAYDAQTDDTDPEWQTYVKTLPRVGSAEPKTTSKTWKALEAWREQNTSHLCDKYYSKAYSGKTVSVILNSYYDNACERVEAGKILSTQLDELKKTMGKSAVLSKIERYNKMNPTERELELKYLTARVSGLKTKVKTAIRVAHTMLDIADLLPDIIVTPNKDAEGDLSPNASPMILEYKKNRANWDIMTIGNFLRLDPIEAHKNLDKFEGNQWNALKDTLGRETNPDESVVVKDDMGADIADKVVFKLAAWLSSAANRTNLNKMKSDKETGIIVRHNMARLIFNLRRIMTDKEYQLAVEEIAKLDDADDTRIMAGGSKS